MRLVGYPEAVGGGERGSCARAVAQPLNGIHRYPTSPSPPRSPAMAPPSRWRGPKTSASAARHSNPLPQSPPAPRSRSGSSARPTRARRHDRQIQRRHRHIARARNPLRVPPGPGRETTTPAHPRSNDWHSPRGRPPPPPSPRPPPGSSPRPRHRHCHRQSQLNPMKRPPTPRGPHSDRNDSRVAGRAGHAH
jgi:hypothetical protein